MSKLNEPPSVKLFMGLIYNSKGYFIELVKELEKQFGHIDFESNEIDFNHSSYYEEEMGKELLRKIITFRKLIQRDDLVDIKAFTNKLEEVFSYEGNRTINIDPGYIAQEHLILATGKGYSHRPYLGKGVYADLTLIYIKDQYRCLEWTYPDYGTQEARKLFKDLRKSYVAQLTEEQNL